MKIGILGTGHIGKTLVRKLGAAGHDVKMANSRSPDTIEADVLAFGGRGVTAAEAVVDVDVIILSIPLNRLPGITPLIATVPAETVVIDTSNYYPHRDGRIDAIEAGQVESLWVVEQLGRPIVKAWNAIGSDSFAKREKPAGSPDRIAIPVAADRETDRKVGMTLVEDTGFDAFEHPVIGLPAEPGRQRQERLRDMPTRRQQSADDQFQKREPRGFRAGLHNLTDPSAKGRWEAGLGGRFHGVCGCLFGFTPAT
jgi:8-hydroxy-5-deazaflavin:NADPH oxidoreductase